MENGKGHNFCKTAAFELLVAFCERVMVGVGRGGLGSGEKVGLVGQSQNSAQLICTEYKHPQNTSSAQNTQLHRIQTGVKYT